MRHPTREDLDALSTERPLFIIHQSGHLGSMNSKGLEMANITTDTEDPQGGVVRRQAGSSEPDGVLEETAMYTSSLHSRRRFSLGPRRL